MLGAILQTFTAAAVVVGGEMMWGDSERVVEIGICYAYFETWKCGDQTY